MPCALNAANEVAVQAFLEGKVTFLGMSDLIEDCLTRTAHIKLPSIDDLIHTDETARRATKLNLQ